MKRVLGEAKDLTPRERVGADAGIRWTSVPARLEEKSVDRRNTGFMHEH